VEGETYEIKSPRTPVYNCLSWALGIEWASFNPEPRVAGYAWFPGIPRQWSRENLKLLFSKFGYREETVDRSLELDCEKVAFYCDVHGEPTHFARQLPSGSWTSKVGRLNDIIHYGLECFEGYEAYGPVELILKRSRKDEQV
jgi:hypothetical protein